MTDLLKAWGTYVHLGPSSISNEDLEDLKKSNLPLTVEEIEEVTKYLDENFGKSIETTKKPKGFNAKDPVTDAKPGNIKGVKAGGTSDMAAPDAKTKEASGEPSTDVYYVSKKDYPKRPKGCIGETPHSWKVPAGMMNAIMEQESSKDPEGGTQEEAPKFTDYVSYSKLPKSREVLEAHLSAGQIADKSPLGVKGATDSIKVVILGNGAGIMKPNVENLYLQKLVTSKSEPKDKDGWDWDPKKKVWSRVEAENFDPFSPTAIGTFGSGNIPFKRNVQREVAAYQVANLLGVAAVPLTVNRTHEGKPHSVQDFKPGCKDIFSYIEGDQHLRDQQPSYYEALKHLAGDKWDEVQQQISDYACFDAIINNQDRHAGNFIIDDNSKTIHLIDHGFSFGNSLHGSRNFFMHSVFHGNKRVSMSATLQKSIKNKSYEDFKRAMPGMYDWEAGQAFLRSRYLVEMQETFGYIDKKRFLPVMTTNDGKTMQPGDDKAWAFGGASKAKQMFDFLNMRNEKELPADVFDSWAKGFLEKASKDESHPDHIDAKQLLEIGVFMEPGFCSYDNGAEGYRKDGLHKEYFDVIQPIYSLEPTVEDYDGDAPKKQFVDSSKKTEAFDSDTATAPANNKTGK